MRIWNVSVSNLDDTRRIIPLVQSDGQIPHAYAYICNDLTKTRDIDKIHMVWDF